MLKLAYKSFIRAALLICLADKIIASTALAGNLAFSGNMSLFQALQHNEPVRNALNPENSVLKLPDNQLITDVRPNLKISDNQIQLVFRPRIKGILSEQDKDPTHESTQSMAITSQVGEAFLQWTLSPTAICAYGRQSYQWGPAELVSPSNHLFHETAQDQGILYQPETKDLLRFNFSYRKNFSTVIMVEYDQNPDNPPFQAEEVYHPTIIIKPEVSWGSSNNYFGMIMGGRENMHPWTGEYFNLQMPFFDGFSLYGDASQQKGSYAFYPVTTDPNGLDPQSGVTTMDITEKTSKIIYNFWVAGLRYDFIGGTIIRIEYVKNDAGYTKKQRDTMITALQSKNPAQLSVLNTNLARFAHPGLELPGQQFSYVSLYYPNLLGITDLKLFMRALYTSVDRSANFYTSLEYKIGDSGTLSGSVLDSVGKVDSELYGQISPSYMLAYRKSW